MPTTVLGSPKALPAPPLPGLAEAATVRTDGGGCIVFGGPLTAPRGAPEGVTWERCARPVVQVELSYGHRDADDPGAAAALQPAARAAVGHRGWTQLPSPKKAPSEALAGVRLHAHPDAGIAVSAPREARSTSKEPRQTGAEDGRRRELLSRGNRSQ
jgi:hypothetical protein